MRQSRTQCPLTTQYSQPHLSNTTQTPSSNSKINLRKYQREHPQNCLPARHNDNAELEIIKCRYMELEQNYNKLMEAVRVKNVEQEKLKGETRKLREQHRKDQQQIQHLRCIIGLVKKKNASTQVEEEEQVDIWQGSGSRLNKFDQSTIDDIKFRHQSAEKASRVQIRQQTPPKKQRNKQEVTVSRVSEARSRQGLAHYQKERRGGKLNKKGYASPYQHLKFVASRLE